MKIIEQPYGNEHILAIFSLPDGTKLYRQYGPWVGTPWYTTLKEALMEGLDQWGLELRTYKRNCSGRRTATEMVARFKKALAAESEAPHA